jgi:uncharacterized membrane protein YebE (DUF533 family)
VKIMGIGKILGLAALGVGAVAAAPFTGGGSVLGAATLAGSLGTAGAVAGAVGAGAAGAVAGKALSDMDEDEKKAQETKIAEYHQKAQKSEAVLKEHEKHTNCILALSALGCSMANADGEISPEEIEELNEFVGGISSQGYPRHIVEQIEDMISNPPTFNEAMEYLTKVETIEFPELRNFLVMIMESDDVIHQKEEAFLKAFDNRVKQLAA